MRRTPHGVSRSQTGTFVLKVCATTLFICVFLPARAGASPILDMEIRDDGSYPPGGTNNDGKARVLGWEFSLSDSLDVRGLGIWDGNPNGTGSHSIGLWTASGTNLVTADLSSGSCAVTSQVPGIGRWLFMPVEPTSIGPGDYVLGATYAQHDSDSYRMVAASYPYVTLPGVAFRESRWLESSSLAMPTGVYSTATVLLGPNLDAGVVPEPRTLLLLSAGLAGLAGRLRRRIR